MLISLNEIYLSEDISSKGEKRKIEIGDRVSFECYIEQKKVDESQITFTFRDGMNKIQGYKSLKEEIKKFEIPNESFVMVTGIIKKSDSSLATKRDNFTIPSLKIEVETIETISKCEAKDFTYLTNYFGLEISEEKLRSTEKRFLSLRLIENQAVFSIRSKIKNIIRNHLRENEFVEIDIPVLLSYLQVAEDQSFRVSYFGKQVYLNQHAGIPLSICLAGGMQKLFRISENFRAEKKVSGRHLTQFTAISFQMTLKESETEIHQFIWKTLSSIFSIAEKECVKELKILRKRFGESVGRIAIGKEPIIITYNEAIELVNKRKENDNFGVIGNSSDKRTKQYLKLGDDLRPEDEKFLGNMIKEKYQSDFFIIKNFPYALRGFSSKKVERTMNTNLVQAYCFDTLMKGEEISSGSVQESNYKKLRTYAKNRKSLIGIESFEKNWLEGFKYGVPSYGGAAFGFDRLVKLFLGFDDIKTAVLFPRDASNIDP